MTIDEAITLVCNDASFGLATAKASRVSDCATGHRYLIQAETYYDQIPTDPNDPDYHLRLGDCLVASRLANAAQGAYDACKSEGTDITDVIRHLASEISKALDSIDVRDCRDAELDVERGQASIHRAVDIESALIKRIRELNLATNYYYKARQDKGDCIEAKRKRSRSPTLPDIIRRSR